MDLASLDPALNSTEVVNQPKHGKTLGKEHKQKQNLNNDSFGNSTSSQNDAGGIAVGLDEGERDGSGEGVGFATVEGVLGAFGSGGRYHGHYPANAEQASGDAQNDDVQMAPVVAPQAAENSKRHWNPIEDATILSLVEQHGPRNWAKIASLLGTGRSGPSCCARWCRLAGPKADATADDEDTPAAPTFNNAVAYKAVTKGKRTKWTKWTKDEDALLKALVEKHGPKNWTFISSQMKTPRSDDSCCGRWTHYLAPKTVSQVGPEGEVTHVPTPKHNSNAANPRWTPREDAQLTVIKTDNPEASWSSVGENMTPKRSAGSCRARWVQHIMGRPAAPKPEEEEPAATILALEAAVAADAEAASASASGDLLVGPQSLLPNPTRAGPSSYVEEHHADLSTLASILDPALLGIGGPLRRDDDHEMISTGVDEEEEERVRLFKEERNKERQRAIAIELEKSGRKGTTWVDGQGQTLFKALPTAEEQDEAAITMARLEALRNNLGPEAYNELAVPSTSLKPAILNPWTPEEEAHLLSLVTELGRRGWQKIANRLGTGRSAAGVSARWQRLTSVALSGAEAVQAPATPTGEDTASMDVQVAAPSSPDPTPATPPAPPKPRITLKGGNKGNWKAWTLVDDAEVIAGVSLHGKNSWATVGKEMSSPRSGYAVSSRWYEHISKMLQKETEEREAGGDGDAEGTGANDDGNEAPRKPKPSISKRRWTAEEDAELRNVIATEKRTMKDAIRWNEVGKRMSTNRPGSSCRLRWLNYLCKIPAPASPEIDELGEDDLVDLAIAVEASTSNSLRDPSIDLAAMLAQNDEEHLSFLALLPAHSSAGPASGSGAQVPALGLDLSLEMGLELDIPVGESSGGGAGEGAKRAHEEEDDVHGNKKARV